MPCSIMFVTQSRCGIGFFSTPWIELWSRSSSFVVFTVFRIFSIAHARNPPVPQAGSRIDSPSFGSTWSTMNCVTARGV